MLTLYNSYIHGGAWRDPRIAHESFWPSIKHIASEAKPSLGIRGFIAIDYRLSPHPDHPQDEKTPARDLRNSKHPDHIQDVFQALAYLQKTVQLGNDYVLIGHSAGATLAFQTLMGDSALGQSLRPEIPQPTAIVGISGIYDLVGLIERFGDAYRSFIKNAFDDEQAWHRTSPATFDGGFGKSWSAGKLALLAWSPEDSLIDELEIANMSKKLEADGIKVVVDKSLHGDHDEVWQDGSQLCRLVVAALESL